MALLSRRWRPGRGGRHTDNRDWRDAASYPQLRVSEVIVAWSGPLTLEPGHNWSPVPCLVCAQPAGQGPVECAVIMGAGVISRRYDRPGAAGFLVCAEHPRLEALELYELAHRREMPGCRCFTRSAGAESTYPYHEGIKG